MTDVILGQMVDVLLDGDPFPSYVEYHRLEKMGGSRNSISNPAQSDVSCNRLNKNRTYKETSEAMPTAAATKPNPRELRKQAKALRIPGWQDMGVDELVEAIATAENKSNGKKTSTSRVAKAVASAGRAPKASSASKANAKTSKAVAARKAKTEDAEEVEANENGNPYKAGTNLYEITEELLKGGKRSDMVKRLKRKIDLKPRTNVDDFDVDSEMDRRILIVGQLLRKDHDFEVTREGRGSDATIVAVAP